MNYRYDDMPKLGYHGTPQFTEDTIRSYLVREVIELKEQNEQYRREIKKLRKKLKKISKPNEQKKAKEKI